MRTIKEVMKYLEGERKAQANIPQQDRKDFPEVLATDTAYTALRQSLTLEQFLETLRQAELTTDNQEFLREYHQHLQMIIDYAQE